MATNLMRYELDGAPHWGVASASGIAPLDGGYPTTAALIEHGEADWRAASARAPSVSFEQAAILSPVTTPCRIYCQGANYRQHMIESGMDPDAKAFNMFFTKSDASVSLGEGNRHAAEARFAARLRNRARPDLPAADRLGGDRDARERSRTMSSPSPSRTTSAPATCSCRKCNSSRARAIAASARSAPG